MSIGWISLHRKILDNPIICKDTDYFSIWCYLLLNATHKEQRKEFNGKTITLEKGQLITGRKAISVKFNISESKVQRVLKRLEIEQQIEQQTSTKNRLISILNWSSYQDSEQQNEQQVNNKRTTSEQQVNTNNNVNKDNNVNNANNKYVEIYEYYLTLNLKKHKKYTSDMEKAIKKAEKELKLDIDEMKLMLKRHEEKVEATKNNGVYAIKKRPLAEFFGQKKNGAISLICADYLEENYQEIKGGEGNGANKKDDANNPYAGIDWNNFGRV